MMNLTCPDTSQVLGGLSANPVCAVVTAPVQAGEVRGQNPSQLIDWLNQSGVAQIPIIC